MSILGGNASGASQINLGDVNDENVGQIGYYHGDNSMRFVANGQEAMRLDSSQNVSIPNGDLTVGGTATVGTASSYLLIGSTVGADAHIIIGGNLIHPATSTGTAKDNAIDIGGGSNRFKDLYLSGGVYLGGTGNANKLDDYEEGTWTPVYTADSGAATYNIQTGSYVKVGKLVTVIGELQASRNTLSGAVTITGLPFASSGNGSGFNPTFTIRFASDMPNLKGYTSASSIVLKTQATSSTNSVNVIETDLSNTATNHNYLYFTATYMTA